jgi:hypothetical protein
MGSSTVLPALDACAYAPALSHLPLVPKLGRSMRERDGDNVDSMAKRPAGITIIGVLATAAGIIYLLQGIRILGWVVFGPGQAFTNASLTGWLTLILGFVWFSVGGAFLTGKPWAWLFGVIIVGISLIEAFFGNLNGWSFGDLFTAMIVPLIILFYLNSEKVKASFGMEG